MQLGLRYIKIVHVVVLIAYLSGISLFFDTYVARPIQISLAATGATYDLATSANWNTRFDGGAANDQLDRSGMRAIGDLDGNGKNDLILGSARAGNNGLTSSGSLYIVYDSLLDAYSTDGLGTSVDLNTSSKYNLRIDAGSSTNSNFSIGSVAIADINNNGHNDIIFGVSLGTDSLFEQGFVYVIYDSIFGSLTGTGNTLSLADTSKFNIRIQGTTGSSTASLLSRGGIGVGDIDGDSKNDIVVGAPRTGGNASNPSTVPGELYVINNTILSSYTTTGNVLSLSSSSNYNIKYTGEANGDELSSPGVWVDDFDGNGRDDILVGASHYLSGGVATQDTVVYYIKDSILRGYSGTGNAVNLADVGTYSQRFRGNTSTNWNISPFQLVATSGDITNDGNPDIVLGFGQSDNNSLTNSGSAYILNHDILASFSDGATIDMSQSSNYNMRIDGGAASDFLGMNAALGDLNGDGKLDLGVGAVGADLNSRSASGSLYILYNSFIAVSSTGNLLNMANAGDYSVRYDGAVANDNLTSVFQVGLSDINRDGLADILVGAPFTDFNSRTNSGSLYILHSFPHSIAINDDSVIAPSVIRLNGSVNASNSISTITNVEYSLDTATYSGTWSNCSPDDGAFNGKTEAFTCDVTFPSSGAHTIRVRAIDSNGVYTAVSSYGSRVVTYSPASFPLPSSSATATSSALPSSSPSAKVSGSPSVSPSLSPSPASVISPVASTQLPVSSATSRASAPYSVEVREDGQGVTILSLLKMVVTDAEGRPLANQPVTLHSDPQTVITDNQGVATFRNVPVGEHRLVYAGSANRKAEVALNLKVAEKDGKPTEVTIELQPINVPLPFVSSLSRPFLILLLTFPALGYMAWLIYKELEVRHGD